MIEENDIVKFKIDTFDLISLGIVVNVKYGNISSSISSQTRFESYYVKSFYDLKSKKQSHNHSWYVSPKVISYHEIKKVNISELNEKQKKALIDLKMTP